MHNFIRRNFFNFILLLFVFSIFAFPKIIFAATIYFTSGTQDIYEGDTFIVETKISSPDKLINVIDGAILFNSDKIIIKELSTGGSVFPLWAQKPVFSNTEGKITFVAGTPDGFQGQEGTMFKIIFTAKKEGESQMNFSSDSLVFLSDGKGTKISYQQNPATLSILKRPAEVAPKDEWQKIIEEDKIPPEPFEVTVSRDPTIFDNQYFVTFFATDKDSGIAYYEVKEGSRDFVRAESPYLLKDQLLQVDVQVKAVDRAGNERIETLPVSRLPAPAIPYKTYLMWGIIILLMIIGVVFGLVKSKIKYQKSK